MPTQSFKVSRAGQEKEYTVHTGYGYFITSFQKAGNMLQVAKVVEKGLQSMEIAPILDYLDFKISDIATALKQRAFHMIGIYCRMAKPHRILVKPGWRKMSSRS